MNYHRPHIALLLFVSATQLGAQSARSDLRAAIVKAVNPSLGVVLLVPTDRDDADLAKLTAAKAGSNYRGLSKAKSCGETYFPKCSWNVGVDTTAVRIMIESETGSTVTAVVDTWGVLSMKKTTKIPLPYLAKDRLTLCLKNGKWKVVSREEVFTT